MTGLRDVAVLDNLFRYEGLRPRKGVYYDHIDRYSHAKSYLKESLAPEVRPIAHVSGRESPSRAGSNLHI